MYSTYCLWAANDVAILYTQYISCTYTSSLSYPLSICQLDLSTLLVLIWLCGNLVTVLGILTVHIHYKLTVTLLLSMTIHRKSCTIACGFELWDTLQIYLLLHFPHCIIAILSHRLLQCMATKCTYICNSSHRLPTWDCSLQLYCISFSNKMVGDWTNFRYINNIMLYENMSTVALIDELLNFGCMKSLNWTTGLDHWTGLLDSDFSLIVYIWISDRTATSTATLFVCLFILRLCIVNNLVKQVSFC